MMLPLTRPHLRCTSADTGYAEQSGDTTAVIWVSPTTRRPTPMLKRG
jgi:hypothetical protein